MSGNELPLFVIVPFIVLLAGTLVVGAIRSVVLEIRVAIENRRGRAEHRRQMEAWHAGDHKTPPPRPYISSYVSPF